MQLDQEIDLVKERSGKLANSPKNSSSELQEKRSRVEKMKQELDETFGNHDLHSNMTALEAEIRVEEDAILEELEPGYVESYNKRLAVIRGR